ncbi:Reactivating factor of Adenosylcobalamin-dependent ethanolamine ammonia lyase [Selenomonas ruminantium]|uniref:Reactivating factor of Adenosylcobalamin-dependent ethanolamine ammonia lyase n=1 Tax=Selenomonas ruminantium TaxID=971 RepID=A0A1M6XQX4_SELRU|nr:ethanolamine ammonia-lyase reactivating factor EutA [Selenomonas ruminantium]SHL08336.1 Reactivating factor of Adenosylcobalamin-dependent ethanolamine ammonia lyase [Selenomonas ruminantium]
MAEEIISAGIDIGTTTSQVIFSRLQLENSSYTAVPNVRIAKKEVIYKSPIHFTPLCADGNIDEEALDHILLAEYEKAHLRREDIATGAVIITGESSRKENARLAVERLSAVAGDFVVATAGPDLESVLAGYGAGAAAWSERCPFPVANFDIGGGTTNVAVFLGGELQDAFALDIGGRLVRLSENHQVLYISPRIQPLAEEFGLCEGEIADLKALKMLARRFADICLRICLERPLSMGERGLFLGHGKRWGKMPAVMFSGGVAEYIYGKTVQEDCWADVLRHGDIGPLVGAAFRRAFADNPEVRFLTPRERIRATVIGAGSYAVHLSGSTVMMAEELAPLQDIPVIRLDHPERTEKLAAEYRLKRDIYPASQQTAIAMAGPGNGGYTELNALARSLVEMTAGEDNILLVIMEQDLAKALGLLMQRLGKGRQIICLDRIRALPGDYIDVGRPVAGTVPVVVKTLIFKS